VWLFMHSAVLSTFFRIAPSSGGGGGRGGNPPLATGRPERPEEPESPDFANAGIAMAATPTARIAAAIGRPFPSKRLIIGLLSVGMTPLHRRTLREG
jgi:hypothetical protein